LSTERDDLVETLRERRDFLRTTLKGVSDEDAGRRTTVSELCLGGIVKHVADTEDAWAAFITGGAPAMDAKAAAQGDWLARFRMEPGDTVASVLAQYDEVAARTDALILSVPDLDASHPLPQAPWFPPGKSWTVRRVVLHLIGETAQHSGHADILRESIDGAKTMG
jgi:uncharacterized damage-inducible protein DinB